MSKGSDWRGEGSADGFEHLERPELAAEFLRRNQAYTRDYNLVASRLAAGLVSEAEAHANLARRWGVTFRLCSG